MPAQSNFNESKNRVEIAFTRPPGRFTKNELSRRGFTYEPDIRTWVRDGSNEDGVGRIIYQYESE